jgi:hypothetical protein
VLYLIFRAIEAAQRQFERANGKDIGIVAGDVEGKRPRLVLELARLKASGVI